VVESTTHGMAKKSRTAKLVDFAMKGIISLFYYHIPHFSVFATREYVKRTQCVLWLIDGLRSFQQ
jgi:hypothetical protein